MKSPLAFGGTAGRRALRVMANEECARRRGRFMGVERRITASFGRWAAVEKSRFTDMNVLDIC